MSDQPQTRRAGVREAAVQYLQFEPNQGQAAKAVRYLSRGPKHSIEVFDDGIALSAQRPTGHAAGSSPLPAGTEPARAQLRFVGASDAGHFESREPAVGQANYLTGGDASKWIRGVPRFRQLRYADLYPGIDLVYYSRDGELEFDLVVKPGADPSRIRLQVGGAAAPVITDNGDLLLDGANGALRLHRPVLYQNIDGEKRVLDAQYVLGADRALGFVLPAYDKRYPLIIDPVFKLLYSTYLTGFHDEQVGGMAVDAQGNAYIVGRTDSDDFVVSGNAYQRGKSTSGLQYNVVVTKFDASGTLIYSTYLGGSGSDIGAAITVDAAGNAYLTGNTTSRDFPVTAGAQQAVFGGALSAFLTVLSPDGSTLAHSTYYGGGGNAQAGSIALDASGAIVLSGSAGPGLVTTAGAYKTTLATGNAAFIAKFSAIAAGAPQLLAASYFGVDNPQANSTALGNSAFSMALDAAGAPWITGQTHTTNLPVTAAAVQAAPASMSASCAAGPAPLNSFAFVAKLSADLTTLAYASYLTGATEPAGGAACAEFGRAIALDVAGNVYVTGGTASAAFPTTAGAVQTAFPSAAGVASYTGFVTKLKPDGSAILWSTYLGGNGGNTFPAAIAIDPGANAVWTTSVTGGGGNYPITTDALQAVHGGGGADVGIVQLDATTGALKYSTFLGGSSADVGLALGVDSGGNAFVAGNTFSTNFPLTGNAYEKTFRPDFYGGADWFFSVLGSGVISQVRPGVAGNTGDVTITAIGAGFESGATVELVLGSTTLTAQAVNTGAGDTLGATFALDGAAVGAYDLVVRNPAGTVLRKAAAVTVAAGGRPSVWVNVLGRPVIRTGVPQTFNVVVGNSGSIDAYFTRLWISFPSSMKYTIAGGVRDVLTPGIDYTSLAGETVLSESTTYIPIVIPLLKAGTTETLPLGLTSTEASLGLAVDAFVRPPWFDTRQGALDALARAEADPAALSSVCSIDPARPDLRNCLGEFVIETANNGIELQAAPLTDTPQAPLTITPDPALVTLGRRYAVNLLRDSLGDALSRAAAAGRPPSGRVAALGFDASRKHPQCGPPCVAAVTWVLTKLGEWAFNKELDKLAKPPVIDPWDDPRVYDESISKGPCIHGKRSVTITYYYKNPLGTKTRSRSETCGSQCPKPRAGRGRGGRSSIASAAIERDPGLATRPGRTSLLAARPLAAGGTCDAPPPDECDDVGNPDNNSGGEGGGSCSSSGGSIDPNDKFGTTGDGTASHWMRKGLPLSYQIAFENQPVATLPAAGVVVMDQLDKTRLDLSTLALGSISWGAYRIDVPPGLTSYTTLYPVDATKSVRVQGSLNPSTGMLKWTFTTIDPATLLPPSDPTLGFLPPDSDGVKGQGYVSFTVKPLTSLAEGTVIANGAAVVFDANAAIATPTWVNTIDSTAPTSKVQSLVGIAGTQSFDVAWASPADAGSSGRTYTIYVSDNGGAYAAWLTSVSATSASYGGSSGHTYAFHAVATDGAGNTEAAKSSAEATIAVNGAFPDPTVGTSSGGGGCTISGGESRRDAGLPLLVLFAAAWLALARRRSRRCPQP